MLPDIWKNRGALAGPSMDDFIERFFYGWPAWNRETDMTWTPRVDVHETDTDILMDVEVPGLKKEDIKVEVKNNTLTISGERKYERESKEGESSRVERHYGKFERSFGLPETVAADKISAEYDSGVLQLKLPKTEKALPKEISVNVK